VDNRPEHRRPGGRRRPLNLLRAPGARRAGAMERPRRTRARRRMAGARGHTSGTPRTRARRDNPGIRRQDRDPVKIGTRADPDPATPSGRPRAGSARHRLARTCQDFVRAPPGPLGAAHDVLMRRAVRAPDVTAEASRSSWSASRWPAGPGHGGGPRGLVRRREPGTTRLVRRSIHIGWFFVLLWLALTILVVGAYFLGGE
jgi:hypothetical protein